MRVQGSRAGLDAVRKWDLFYAEYQYILLGRVRNERKQKLWLVTKQRSLISPGWGRLVMSLSW